MADHAPINLGQQTLLGTIGRIAQGAEERLSIRTVKHVKQGLVHGFMVGFGSKAILDRAAAKRQAYRRRWSFHRVDHSGNTSRGAGTVSRRPRGSNATHHATPCSHCTS